MNWKAASNFELKQFQAIGFFLSHRSELIQYLFDSDNPRLNTSPENLIAGGRGLCSSDRVLIRVALQLWCEYGQIGLQELFCLDREVFLNVLKALDHLGPKL